MSGERPFKSALARLNLAGLRPTRQRLGLARLLFERGDRHFTAEQLHVDAVGNGLSVSLATIYNALNQFTEAGLLREVVVEAGRSYYDTNTSDHHHFFREDLGLLEDVPEGRLTLSGRPEPPAGTRISRIEVIVHLVPDADGC